MTNTNCPNCDRDQCPTLFATFARMPPSSSNRAMADCANHTVNWRARALTETARADAAEAELRALREALPKWETDGNAWKLQFGPIERWVLPTNHGWLADGYGIVRDSRDEAMALVVADLGLPPCEVLP